MRRRLPVLCLAVAACGATPAVAQQQTSADPFPAPVQGPYSEGALAYAVGINCTSLIFGPAYVENQVAAGASQQASPQDIPHAGEVFYVRLLTGIVGGPCGGNDVLPEFVLPAGVFPAVSATRPLRARYGGSNEKLITTGLKVGPGSFGGVRVLAPDNQGIWPTSREGGELEVFLPVVAARRLKGIGAGNPVCPGAPEGDPCPPDKAADTLQIATDNSAPVTPQRLVSTVGLFAREPAAPTLAVRPARTLRITTAPLATVRVKAGPRLLKTLKAGRSGVVSWRYAKALRGRTVRVTATAIDGALSAAAAKRLG